MNDEVLQIVDRGDHFEPRGLWYENVEQRVLRDLRKLLVVLGGDHRSPVIGEWVPEGEQLRRRTMAIRGPGRTWSWTELSEGVERFAVELDGCSLHCVLEKERTRDRWTTTLVRGDTRTELPDDGVDVSDGAPLRLVLDGDARIVGQDGALQVRHAPIAFEGGQSLPPETVQSLEIRDGDALVELSTIDALRAPRLRVTTNLIDDGGVLSTPSVPLSVETAFRGVGPFSLPLEELDLQGVSLRPTTLRIGLEHHIGDRVERIEVDADRAGGAYVLAEAWSPRSAPIGHVVVEVLGQGPVGRQVLDPPPLRARWEHPEAIGAAPAPRVVELQSVDAPGVRWSLGPDGDVHYPETGQVGALDDLAFEPLLAATPRDLVTLLRAGPIDAWVPGRHHIVLADAGDLDSLRPLFRGGEPVRIGRGPGRGLLHPSLFEEHGLVELDAVGGRFHLESEGAVLVFHRGLLLNGHVRALGESGQWAIELDEALPLFDRRELGPFWPARAWKRGDVVRLRGRGAEARLEARGDHELRGDGVQYRFEGFGYDALLPVDGGSRLAWNGLLIDEGRFAGWLLEDGDRVFAGEGPFAGWTLSRAGAEPSRDPGRPAAVQAAVDALMQGTRVAAEVVVDTAEGRWVLSPRYAHPRKPPVRVDVEAPGHPVDERPPAVRIWVDA